MTFLRKKNSGDVYQSKLNSLIKILKDTGFLTSAKVEVAMKKIPRHKFIPKSLENRYYENGPLPILNGQTISQPSVVARMTEWLDIREGQKILEIGSGSGWQSAIISNLVGNGKIYTIERHEKLANFAKENLEKCGITNVKIIHGDGRLGLSKESPFDRIIITAACNEVPKELFNQLNLGGLLIAPIGDNIQSLILFKKTSKGIIKIKNQKGYVFVPFV